MKILFFGAGVINTLYAWALKESGNDVTIYVRPGKEKAWEDGIKLDVISERFKKKKYVKETFKPNIVTSFKPEDRYDLIIESVKHYQTEEILPHIAQNAGNALVLFFNNNWDGLGFIDKYLPKTRYVLGMPRAGGIITNGLLDGAITENVMLGESTCGKDAPADVRQAAKENLDKIAKTFEEAGVKPNIQENMEHWYWAHLASTVPWISGGAKARGFLPFVKSNKAIRESLEAGREIVEIVKARGVDVTKIQDLQMFIAPIWISAFMTKMFIGGEVSMKISSGHGAYAPDELQKIYRDVVGTGKQLGVSTPKLDEFKKYIDEMSNIQK
jgi:2-dehydropantoate 2-reductase